MALDHRAARDLAQQAIAAESFDPPEWSQPESLSKPVDANPYPIDALPEPIGSAVEEVAAFVKAPLPLVASSALCAMSIAVQSLCNVRRSAGLVGPSSLYCLVIAPSGERKTEVEKHFTQPLREFELVQREAMKPKIEEYRSRLASYESQESGIRDQLRQLARDGKPTKDAERRLFELMDQKPTPPRIPRLLFADVTPEALAQRLQLWPSGGAVCSEAGVFFGAHGMSSESAMRNISQLNVLWDGGPLTVDRKSAESILVRAARLSIGLQVQPATLHEFIKKNGALARGSGFWARFLITAPTSTKGTRLFEEAPARWPQLTIFQSRLSALLALPLPLDELGALHPPELSLTPSAKKEWIEFHDTVEKQLSDDGEFSEVADIASKSADNAARLAAGFHIIAGADGDISAENMRRGCTIALWHLYEARRVFSESTATSESQAVFRLDSWLVNYCRTNGCLRVARQTAMQRGPRATRPKESLDAALAVLAKLNRLRINGPVIELNPKLLSRHQEDLQ